MSELPIIPISRPSFDDSEVEAVAAVLRTAWVAQGPQVAQFEAAVARSVGASHAVACTSGTTALHLALASLDIGPGDEVIVPSFTFIATANAVVHAGATPVFADIDPATYNLDPASAAAAITPRTKAIMPVHQIGLAADLDPLLLLALQHGLFVVEDAACALGATYKGRPVGGTSDAACISFHPRKVITTGEGGMVTTNRPEVAEKARRLRNHAARAQARPDYLFALDPTYEEVGYNFRMTDLQAAIGLAQLRKLPEFIARRREIARRYDQWIAAHDDLEAPYSPSWADHTYNSYCVRVREGGEERRNAILNHLAGEAIAARPGLTAVHELDVYRRRYPGLSLPATEAAARTTFLLPIYPALSDAEQDRIIGAVERAVARSAVSPLRK